ncbi:CorA family divalent cation transporter [Jannaschia sp. W003]|uniref:CorA family divalent cation transporter n=1 Tax=Jannaschia sp. W003 TaxID=2867012 RepID=UPI0021A70763|nr:CorA family divalent cation transporter [Jannaschia sp. W003]UWQ20894.1 zinc transporter ZntB [Jannaschia sp. W003]
MDPFIRHAYALHARRPLRDAEEAARLLRDPEPAWVHLQADDPRSGEWIARHLDYLPPTVRAALTAAATRPRLARVEGGVLLILRGLNTNPGAEPEDMVSLRMWIEPARVVTLSVRELATVRELADETEAGQGPEDAGALLAFVAGRLTAKLSAYADGLDEEGDALERTVLAGADAALGPRISDIRGEVVDLRQFLAPQRDALSRLHAAPPAFLREADAMGLREALEEAERALEVVGSLHDRLVVLKDELAAARDERLNRNLYRLSVISAVFLPLGVLTGLMGINLAGMPGANWEPAFWVFTALMVAIALGQLVLLRWLRWL